MNSHPQKQPLVKLGGVWENTSAKGTRYFSGRLGAAKVVILENKDRQSDSEPTHNIFVQNSQPKGSQ